MAAELRELYTTILKDSLDYILEDIEEAKLFEMVSIMAKLAEQSAHTRRERKLRDEYQENRQRCEDSFALSRKIPMPVDMSLSQHRGGK